MTLSRRRFVGIGGASAALALLAACGGGAAAPTSAPAKPTEAPKPAPTQAAAAPAATTAPAAAATKPAAGATTAPAGGAGQKVLYWGAYGGNLAKQEGDMVDRFNKQSKGTQVDYQNQNDYATAAQKLSAALAAKQGIPDVVILSDVWWQKFWLNKTLQPYDSYFATAKIDKNDYVDSFVKEGTRQGKLMWVPFARSTPMLYYNKDQYKAAGLADKAPETWQEFQDNAPKLVKREGNELKVAALSEGLAASFNAWIFQCIAWEFGGHYSDDNFNITITDPGVVEAGHLYQDMVFKTKIASVPKDNVVDFQNGLAAMTFASTASLAGIESNAKFAVGTGFMPKGKQFGCCTGGAGFGLMATSPEEKRVAAFEYVSFATSPEQTAIWSQNTGYMPVRKSAIDGAAMNQFYKDHPNFTTAVKQLPLTQGQDAARVGIPNGDNIIGKGLERISVNNEKVEDVFADLKATLEKEAKPVIEQLKALGG
jgi:sn-glycerol 3-phosphate transport system substrate-binding protein